MTIGSEVDIVTARQEGRAVARKLGFSSTDLTVIVTAISELARNIVLYAQRGEIRLEIVQDGSRRGLQVIATDSGPGICDTRLAMRGGHSTSGGLGLGLPGVRRLMVHPGVTGWAQVMQSYAASIEESRSKLQADLYYIKHMSLMTDLYILQKTVKVVLSGHERGSPVPLAVGATADAVAPAVPASLVATVAARPRIIVRRPQPRTSSLADGRRVARTH